MRVITTSGTRTINVVLRYYAASNNYNIVIRNESTNESDTISTTQTVEQIKANEDFFSFDVTTEYSQGAELDFYIVEQGQTKILHRNKIYVTDEFSQATFFLLLENGYTILLENGDKFVLEESV